MKKPAPRPDWQPIFRTAHLRTGDWMLPAMILVGVFIHGIAFYLIQSSAPVAKSTPPAQPTVHILNAARAQDAEFLRWLDNHDPAAIATNGANPQPAAALLGTRYQPSYEQLLPEPLAIPLENTTGRRQTFFPPGPVPEKAFHEAAAPIDFSNLPSRVTTSATLILENARELTPPKLSAKLPLPTQIFVVASPSSDGRFYFLAGSSGDERLDAYAETWLAGTQIRFSEGAQSGWATFYWGDKNGESSP